MSLVIEDPVVNAFDTGVDGCHISEDFKMSIPSFLQRPLVKQFIPLASISGYTL